ncbi:MAG: FAD-dependent monooxygenase [Alphaproteobacteria bacterium]
MASKDRVIVAGAGPVGLVAATYLAKRDIPVTLVETEAKIGNELRASTVHPPTLDMMEEFGIAGDIVEQGLKAPTWQFRDLMSGPVATFDLGVLTEEDTNHPYRVQCEQWKICHLLYDRIKEMPAADLRFGHTALGVEQDGDGVRLLVETANGTESIDGRYVIAADGGRSAVRKSLDVDFEGFTYPEKFLVVSTPFRFEDVLPGLTYINYISDPEEWLVLLRVRDFWRVLLPTDPEAAEDDLLSDETIQARVRAVHDKGSDYEIVHKTLYPIHQRVAKQYRVGNAFLAGDSAHLNNPLGGMGMNGGIHDAMNLAEKIAAVWTGEAPESVLDDYGPQRRSVAIDDVKAQSMRNREILNETDPAARRKRLDEMRRTAEDPALARPFLRQTSMIDSLERAAQIHA